MTLKEVAKRCLPPIIVDGGRYLLKGNGRLRDDHRHSPEWEYIPEGWRSKDPRIKGWNVESILETQRSKWPEFQRSVQRNGPLGVAHEGFVPSNND